MGAPAGLWGMAFLPACDDSGLAALQYDDCQPIVKMGAQEKNQSEP
jgi:hypothetical protein